MDLKDVKEWFASRKRRRLDEQIKQPLTTEEYCALWTQCFQCRELLYTNDLHSNLRVCPKCQYHFRIGAKLRIDQLSDPGTFKELDASLSSADPLKFVDTEPYPERLAEATQKSGLKEAVVTGICSLDGHRTALGVMDFGHFGGSMGSVVGEKIVRLIEKAISDQLPVIMVASSGGARMQEGLLSLMQMAKTSSALQQFAQLGLLYISVLTEPTYGGVTASFAMLGDIIIAEPGARIGFAGRRVIEQTIRQKLPVDFQTAEYLLKAGQVDMVVERAKLKPTLSRFIAFHAHQGSISQPASIAKTSAEHVEREQSFTLPFVRKA